MREIELEFERYATVVRRRMIYERIRNYFEALKNQIGLPPFIAAEQEMKKIENDPQKERRLYEKILEETICW